MSRSENLNSVEQLAVDVALVAKQLAEQLLRQGRDGLAIIHVAGGETFPQTDQTLPDRQLRDKRPECGRAIAARAGAGGAMDVKSFAGRLNRSAGPLQPAPTFPNTLKYHRGS